ncbi:MAG: DUF4783 domain-containing protein [Fimbriimonadaceae bacterium]|nr:DUF4783 domain-containing protein [Chitinophagales bacterium]
MKNHINFKFIVLLAVIPLTIMATAPGGLENIAQSIRSGDAKQVAAYFDKMVEMKIGAKEATYSKAQAEQVLKDFFSKNKPLNFQFNHDGTSGANNAYYAIGTLKTDNAKYRVSVYMKKNGDTFIIQELSIENE